MDVIGKIIQVLPPQGGTSSSGREWKKQEYVLETLESFPRKICFHFFGERVDQFPLQLNQTIKLSFDIESREYNGRWYTNIAGWKAEPADGAVGMQQPPVQAPNYQQPGQSFPTPQPGFGATAATASYQQPAAPAAPATGGFPTPPAEPANDDLPF